LLEGFAAMTHSISGTPSLWSWGTELTDMMLAPFQQTPRFGQDTEVLRQLPFVPGLKELLMLRQVHALEHATVWVLSDRSRPDQGSAYDGLGGMSTEKGFYLYGQIELDELRQAAQTALHRITSGNWDLAVHPRCGTNLSVSVLVMAGMAMGITTLLPRNPLSSIVGFSTAAVLTTQIAPNLGALAQKYLTTAVPFNLAIDRVTITPDYFGKPARFVQVRWID